MFRSEFSKTRTRLVSVKLIQWHIPGVKRIQEIIFYLVESISAEVSTE